ncbi:MAG TPA: alpha-E domain-containing protein [Turneriella sp.]|nr:alpha-E domain-containing protein [Turneriella sp.]HNA79220.1 alpha-E domain-containing protein [Turneriella sp.]HNE19606.1 alpha-E domain-containing protein [Turneriella sp.]HNJ67171.1 alpha-E domain-containing protein [Turneriella sp.]HNL09985.1 alpha-E domain-containing protein [Turneriella sp.]
MHILSRVADSIYWLNRYVERVENYARLLETYQQFSLENPEITAPLWLALVESTADTSGFNETYDELQPENVVEYLTFNRRNPNSIVSCLYAARENARSIREKISKDMWESINELYNDVVTVDAARVKAGAQSGSHNFYRDIRRSCHAFYGISDGTLNHDETYFFALLGRAIERADKTTRILDLQSYMLTSDTQQQFGEGQIVLGLALLRATSAHEMFNQAHARITSENILDFLLLSRTFPRAIIACLLQIEYALRCLAGEQKGFFINAAQKKVQRLLLETRHVDVASLVGQALNGYLDNLQVRLNEIGIEITNTYFTAA